MITSSHEPIISESDFNKVQKILKEREKIYYKEAGNHSIFKSKIKCGICGASYKSKINREKQYYVCINHDIRSDYCPQKGITETCLKQGFITMCNKLIQHYREILLPLRRSLQELNMRRFSGNTKIIDIHKNIADIKEQRHVISRLRKKASWMKKYNEKLTELESQLSRQERELKKISKADNEDNALEQLDTLIDCIERQSDIVIILGDVGINYTGTLRDIAIKDEMNKLGSTFFRIHGNHENRPQNIASYKEKGWKGGRVLYEVDFPNILFPLDGDIFELEGKKCIVIGGAYSVDKFYRLRNGYKWWPDEQPSPSIKEYVEKHLFENNTDVVFSHTCPFKYIPTECFLSDIDQSKVDNSTEQWLDTIEDKIDYTVWYMGHWHIDKHIDKIHFLFHGVEML